MNELELLNYCNKHFLYNSETGIITRSSTNEPTGYKHNGYLRIEIYRGGKRYRYAAHRIAYLMYYGRLPTMTDHINRVKDDNRIINLRECSRELNSINRPMQSNNTTGYRGVTWDRVKNKYKAVLSKRHVGYYSCKIDAAIAWNKAALNRYGGDIDLNTIPCECYVS